jgi:hypothetical protein
LLKNRMKEKGFRLTHILTTKKNQSIILISSFYKEDFHGDDLSFFLAGKCRSSLEKYLFNLILYFYID